VRGGEKAIGKFRILGVFGKFGIIGIIGILGKSE
jgi:hypothetical protein